MSFWRWVSAKGPLRKQGPLNVERRKESSPQICRKNKLLRGVSAAVRVDWFASVCCLFQDPLSLFLDWTCLSWRRRIQKPKSKEWREKIALWKNVIVEP